MTEAETDRGPFREGRWPRRVDSSGVFMSARQEPCSHQNAAAVSLSVSVTDAQSRALRAARAVA